MRGRGLKLDLTRGKPSSAQLDLANPLLHLPGESFLAADGTDTRNYGGLNGLLELREIFSAPLQVPAANLLALDSSSLNVMHDVLINALFSPFRPAPSDGGWTSRRSRSSVRPRDTTAISHCPPSSASTSSQWR